jgi:hypothetical protein
MYTLVRCSHEAVADDGRKKKEGKIVGLIRRCSLAAFSQDGEPIDASAVKHENALKSALTGSPYWVEFEILIGSSDMKGFAHRTLIRVHGLNILPHRLCNPVNARQHGKS